ncbi:MAG: UvrD-helicase domain-containing protein [Treponema sp.]|jgi:ATP-dependent helicase/nuclease subunit A|nr:UvrD-helicase domain-containing protein [Treponema sp.]
MESDIKKTALNKEQSDAAYCTNNAVIAAGAGSGKTLVLASRFAWLVTEKKYRVREILTLTFTKKAAAQMYRRIHLLLAEIAREDTGEKGALARQALDEFTQARIQTLDSYCAGIVKQAATRYGINPGFLIDEDRCRQLAIDEAMPFLINRRNHHAIIRFYPHKNPMFIARDIFAAALINFTHFDSSSNLKQDIDSQFSLICGEWKIQNRLIIAKLRELAEAYDGNEKYLYELAPILSQFTAGNIVFPDERELRIFFDQLAVMPHDSAIEWAESHPQHKAVFDVLTFLSSICSLDLRKGYPLKNPVKESIKELKVLYAQFSSLAVFCIQSGLIYSVLMLLSELQQRYLNRKRSEGILTYHDVARLAKTILMEQPDIRHCEKESFKAIMIDEFQDNNELQKDLLFMLAEKPEITNNAVPPAQNLSEGKLFFVGDEKQSIYRFRGADVSVFRALAQELGSGDLPLKTNYRSAPLLIGAFNAIFGGSEFDPEGEKPLAENPAVFAASSSLPAYEASFAPLRADKKTQGKLTLCILDKQDAKEFTDDKTVILSPVENEARYIAERINTLLQEKDADGKQKYQPHDIAILFRSRKPQYLFEKHLMLLNIPYASEDLNGFFYGGPVNDLMSVLRLAVYPKDRAAYAQMLRSPFAGLSFSALTVCLADMDNSSGPFGNEPLSLLGEEDRQKYSHGQRVYQKILHSACTESISALVSELWYNEGYRYETEWNPKTAAYREMYDYLFHLAAKADGENKTLAAFVDTIQELGKSGKRLSDIEIPLERQGVRASAVHLITIHKSKGLEFPVVFICCCDKQGKSDYSDDVFDTDEFGLTVTPPLPPDFKKFKEVKRNYFWERSVAVERGKSTAELRRLLYVGMTRAENELYLSGCLGISKYLGIDNEDAASDAPELNAGDFSLLCKQFIDKKRERAEGKNPITGDTILEGSTFFGLCLPALGAHIPQEGLSASAGTAASFFNIEKIPVYSEQYMRNAEQHGSLFPNDQKGLSTFLKKVEIFYRRADMIGTPDVSKRHFSPASLLDAAVNGILPGNFIVSREYSGGHAADIFDKVNTLLVRYAKQSGEEGEKFNSGSFGTIAHICVEAQLSGQKAVIPPNLAGLLSPADADTFLDAGKELALRFVRSPLGIIAKKAKSRRSEFAFRSLIYANKEEFFFNGTIDLIFEDGQTVYVVDFKTDNQEFPGEHIPQMACYYRAATELFAVPANKKCTIWLYYLRSGHAVDVTGQARGFNLERAISK